MTTPASRGKILLAKNSVLNLFGLVLPMAVAVVTVPYIVAHLGPERYGLVSIALMVLGYFSIFDLGLSRATVKIVAENLHASTIQKVPPLVWTSLALLMGLGTTGGALLAAFVPTLTHHYLKMPSQLIGEATISLLILAASMPVMLGTDALRGILEAAQRFDWINYVKVPSSIIFYGSVALATSMGLRVPAIVLLLVAIRLMTGLAYLLLCLRAIPELRRRPSISRAAIKPLASFGGWVMVSNTTGPVLGYLERLLIASVLSVAALTYYSVPFDLVGKSLIFPSSIAPTLFPYFTYHASSKGNEVSDVTSRSVRYLLLLMAPITVVLFCFSHEILTLWLGGEFALKSSIVMRLLALSIFVNAFTYVPYSSVQALGRPDLKALLDLAILPTYTILCWSSMRVFGVAGAAVAKLVISAVDTGMLFTFAWRLKAFSPRHLAQGGARRTILASSALFVSAWLIHSLNLSLPVSAAAVVGLLLCYGAAAWTIVIDPAERTAVLVLSRGALRKASALWRPVSVRS